MKLKNNAAILPCRIRGLSPSIHFLSGENSFQIEIFS